jgi:hypothetical protein
MTPTTASILGRCDQREYALTHPNNTNTNNNNTTEAQHMSPALAPKPIHIKVTYWTGTTKEYVDFTMAQTIAIEYPEFATTNQVEGMGWLTYPNEDEGDYSFAQVYNVHGDLCCTFETKKDL